MSKKSAATDGASSLFGGLGALAGGGIPGLSTSSNAESGVRGDQHNGFSTGSFGGGGFDPQSLLLVVGGVVLIWWAMR